MFKKFKILPVVALGICWMVMGNTCFAKTCGEKFNECKGVGCGAFGAGTKGFYGCQSNPNSKPTDCQWGITACKNNNEG